MNRRQRLIATLNGLPVDRPPVSFYEIGGIKMDIQNKDPFNVYNDPSWKPLIELAESCTDIIRMRNPVRHNSFSVWNIDASDSIKKQFFNINQYQKNNSIYVETTIKIGEHKLTSLTRRDSDVDTVWTLKHLIKTKEDVQAYLQLPDEIFQEQIDVTSFLQEEEELADRGIMMIDTEDPMCAASVLFDMQDMLIFAFTEKELFHQLLEKCSRYLYRRTEIISQKLPGRLWRIYGPEFATEPYMPPVLFNEYVVRYTKPMVDMIHKNDGFVRVHCHGRIKNILDSFIKMKADAIDPVEPEPQGDVGLGYVRQRYGENMVLFGNIEVADIENLSSKDFEKVVARSIDEGTQGNGRGFVLMPSASPTGRTINKNTLENYETILRLATSGYTS